MYYLLSKHARVETREWVAEAAVCVALLAQLIDFD